MHTTADGGDASSQDTPAPTPNPASNVEPVTRGSVLRTHIEEFRSNLGALANFVDNVEPVVQAQVEQTQEDAHKLRAYSAFVSALQQPTGEHVPIELEQSGWPLTIIRHSESDGRPVFRFDGDPDEIDRFMAAVTDLAGSPRRLREAKRCSAHAQRQEALLYESSLISLVSIVEWFYSQLMSDLYRWFPDRLNTRDALFSLQDLKGFDTIADAVEQLIEDRVARHVHESVDSWLDDLTKWFHLPSHAPAVASRARIIEVVRRRDVFVHNGGCVSKLYLARVGKQDSQLVDGLEKGARLIVDRDYLDSAIELMETAFLSIALGVWAKVDPDEPGFRTAYLLDLSYDALCEERYTLASYLGRTLSADKDASDWERNAGGVNEWLARKYGGDFEAVKREVLAFDVSALAEEFKLAKAAILENHDAFFEDLRDLIDRRAVTGGQLREWPLYKALRESGRWEEIEAIIAESEAVADDETHPGEVA